MFGVFHSIHPLNWLYNRHANWPTRDDNILHTWNLKKNAHHFIFDLRKNGSYILYIITNMVSVCVSVCLWWMTFLDDLFGWKGIIFITDTQWVAVRAIRAAIFQSYTDGWWRRFVSVAVATSLKNTFLKIAMISLSNLSFPILH
jgi:hypothetical protein